MNGITPLRAIRAKCLDCCCGSPHEVKLCSAKDCSLYTYRLGKDPSRKRNLTDEQRQALVSRLQSAREQAEANDVDEIL